VKSAESLQIGKLVPSTLLHGNNVVNLFAKSSAESLARRTRENPLRVGSLTLIAIPLEHPLPKLPPPTCRRQSHPVCSPRIEATGHFSRMKRTSSFVPPRPRIVDNFRTTCLSTLLHQVKFPAETTAPSCRISNLHRPQCFRSYLSDSKSVEPSRGSTKTLPHERTKPLPQLGHTTASFHSIGISPARAAFIGSRRRS